MTFAWLRELLCFHDWKADSTWRTSDGDLHTLLECARCKKVRYVKAEAAP